MNKIEKLFKKLSAHDREILLALIETLLREDDISHLKPIKLAGMELYRIRKGDFCIIFHKEKTKYIIDSIRIRNKKTYKL